MGWAGRNASTSRNWKSWQAGNRSNSSSYQKKATTKPATKKPAKRPLSKTETKPKPVANKRQKLVSYSKIPLTTVMLVNPGSEDNALPELVFGAFYDCIREAKMGKPRHLLHIDVTKKTEKKKREDSSPPADWRVSIPVPTTSVEAVSIISGTNPFEKLLKAHSDRISLKNSIEHWNKVIRGRTTALQKKEEELQQIIEAIEEAEKSEVNESEKPDDEAAKDDDTGKETDDIGKETDDSPAKSESQIEVDTAAEADGEEENWTKDQETKESQEELKKKAEKKKETNNRKRKFITSVVKKLTAAVEKARESLAREQEKLDKISSELGDELAYFQREITDEDALSYFKQQLEDGLPLADDEPNEGDEDADEGNEQEDEDMEDATESVGKSKDMEETDDVEMAETKDKEGETDKEVKEGKTDKEDKEGKADKEDKEGKTNKEAKEGKTDKEVKEGKTDKEEEEDKKAAKKEVKDKKSTKIAKITETPVWLVVSLKKSLDKAIVTKNAPCTTADHIKKASMILMKFQPKHKKTIVLKGVTYHGSQEYLKVLNMVLEGPWKAVRKDPEELMKSKSRYSLMRTLQYLVMCQTRREVMDNILENCKLCEKPLKHSAMKQHVTDFCPMREKPCQFCATVFAVSLMKEHHESVCTKYPISCPLKCTKKFARAEAEEHKKVCLNAVVQCEFESFGCSKKLKRKDLARHLKIAVFEHLELVKGRVAILTEHLMKSDPALRKVINPICPDPESE